MTFAKLTSAFFVHVLNWIFFQILLKDRQATERKRELKVCSEKNNKPWYHRVHHLARCIPYHVCCYNSEPYLSIVLFIKKKRSLRTRAKLYLVIKPTIVVLTSIEFLYVNEISVQQRTQLQLAALEVFLPNRNAFVFVASLKIYCTSRRVILRTSCGGIFHCIFCLLVFIKH